MNMFIAIPASPRSVSKRKTVYGVGINDAEYTVRPRVNGVSVWCPYFRTWQSMLERCYSERFLKKHLSYVGCFVDPSWLRFSTFKLWMQLQSWKGNDLDKDILVYRNKKYGPDTCVFVSHYLNTLVLSCRGSVGVSFEANRNTYRVKANQNGTSIFLGRFKLKKDAEAAYIRFKVATLKKEADKQQDSRVRAGLIAHARQLIKTVGGI